MQKIFLVALLLTTGVVYGQQADSIKKEKQVKYYRQQLGLGDSQAGQVNAVQEQYKSALKAITADHNLSEAEKRKAAEKVMAEKNRKLCGLLSAEQLDVVVPAAERKRSKAEQKRSLIVTRKDTSKLQERMSQALVIPKDKAQQVTLVQLTYKEKLRHILSDTTLRGGDRQARITGLTRERNKQLKALLTAEQLNKIVPPSEQKL